MDTNLSEKMLDAFSIIAEHNASNQDNDETIECEIVKVQNAAKGVYTVKHQEGKWTAHSSTSERFYTGDIVYVLIPQGDYTKNKIILGPVKATLPPAKTQEVTLFNEISENFLKPSAEIELCTYFDDKKILFDGDAGIDLVSTLIKDYKTFVFCFDIRTQIADLLRRKNGNYGAKITVPYIDTTTGLVHKEEHVIDIKHNNILGNAYNLNDYITQHVTFTVDDKYEFDKNAKIKVEVYTEGFSKGDIRTPDIFVKNIGLKAIEYLDSEQLSGFFLDIKSDSGFQFLDGIYELDKKLTPELKVGGVPADVRNYDCLWAVEDLSINDSSEYYNIHCGVGWRVLNARKSLGINDDGQPTYDYIRNVYELRVSKADVYATAKYKCVLYDSNDEIQKVVEIVNKNNEVTFSLDTDSKNTTFIKNVGDVTLEARIHFPGVTDDTYIKYKFERLDKDGNYIDDNFFSTVKYNERIDASNPEDRITVIKFPVSKIDELNTVKCEFSYEKIAGASLEKHNLGSANIVLTIGEELDNYYFSLTNDDILYKYDADGNSPMLANFTGPLQSIVGKINPINLRVFKMDGNELSTSEYNYLKLTWKVPKDSMIIIPDDFKEKEGVTFIDEPENDFYIIEGFNIREFPYEIEPTFDLEKRNNTILVTGLYDNQTIQGKASFKFLKDGQSGANGTQYAGVITYDGYTYGELDKKGIPHKLRGVFFKNQWWYLDDKLELKGFNQNPPMLDFSLYKNGKYIGNAASFGSVSWQVLEYSNENSYVNFDIDSNGRFSSRNNSWVQNMYPCNIVQATVEITAEDDNSIKEVIIAYYPIDVIYINDSNVALLPDIQEGFSEVLYSSNLNNPQYNNNKPFEIKMLKNQIKFVCTQWKSSDSLEYEDEQTGNTFPLTANFSPEEVYCISRDNGAEFNWVSATIKPDKEATETAQQKLINAGNALNEQIELQNKEKTFVDAFVQVYDLSSYEDRIDAVKTYMTYRAKYYTSLNNLLIVAENLAKINEEKYGNYPLRIQSIIQKLLTAETVDDIECIEEEIPNETEETNVAFSTNVVIYNFNERLADCQREYNFLTKYNYINSELKNYNDIQVDLLKIPSQISEAAAAQNYDITGTEFNTIKDLLNVRLTSVFNNTDINTISLMTVSKYVSLLNEIEEKFAIYRESNYITNKYSEKISALQAQYDELNTEDIQNISAFSDYGSVMVVRPIVFNVDKYELSNLNAWDGNKIKSGDDYFVAPQVAAGKKESDNSFTGLIMGTKKSNKSDDQVGLFGQYQGTQTLFLDAETGKLELGMNNGGQIIFDPTATGSDPKAIIAGWEISENALIKDGAFGKVTLSSSGNYALEAVGTNGSVKIGYDGTINAINGVFTGTISATAGTIGGWQIGSESGKTFLKSKNYSASLNTGIRLDPVNEYIKIGSSMILRGNSLSLRTDGGANGYGDEINTNNTAFQGVRITSTLFFAGQKQAGKFNVSKNTVNGSYIYTYSKDGNNHVIINADQMNIGPVRYGSYNANYEINIGSKREAGMPKGTFIGKIYPGNTGEGDPTNNRISVRDKAGNNSKYVYLDGALGCIGIGANYEGSDDTTYLQTMTQSISLYGWDRKVDSTNISSKNKIGISAGYNGTLPQRYEGNGILCCKDIYINNKHTTNNDDYTANRKWMTLYQYIQLVIKENLYKFVNDNILSSNANKGS